MKKFLSWVVGVGSVLWLGCAQAAVVVNVCAFASPNAAVSIPVTTKFYRSIDGGPMTFATSKPYGETQAALCVVDPNVAGGHTYVYQYSFDGQGGSGANSPSSAPLTVVIPLPATAGAPTAVQQ